MNIADLNSELTKLVQRAYADGVSQNKLDVVSIVGLLEMHKLDIIRHTQDLARAQMAREMAQKIQPATILPPGRNGHP